MRRGVRYVSLLLVLVVNSAAIHLLHPLLVLLYVCRLCPSSVYNNAVDWSKRAYVDVLHLICLLFPSESHVLRLSLNMHDMEKIIKNSTNDKHTNNKNKTVDANCWEQFERILRTKRIVVIANHQAYLDWFYIWLALSTFNCHHQLRIILKDSLRWLPLFGTVLPSYILSFCLMLGNDGL